MGDDDRGPAGHELPERVLDEVLGLGVDARGRLVENEDLGLVDQRPREREQLALTDRKGRPRSPTFSAYPAGSFSMNLSA